ncbi:MAG: response regulator transcription factor [Oscillospiraceae bacterium]|jgi:DNA-binding response OmpR family regulator|nr:response regulator transcription factor [Oscillospiraceae bacterium]MCR5306179.1 response regulator transcription factor [Oscillospiraceae bacterium]
MISQILLAEDDAQIREVIEDYFSEKGEGELCLTSAKNGSEALALFRENQYDLLMLDVMMPDIDGFSLCREFRTISDVPILFLTARAREEDVLYGYSLGCDDYIIKPFSLAALLAKVSAILKRTKGTVCSQEIVCGAICMNLRTMEVTANGVPVTLAPKEYELLRYLLEHKNWVLSRDQLLDRVWGQDYFGSDRVVDNHIKKLRHALGEAGRQIRTVITKGYQLTE